MSAKTKRETDPVRLYLLMDIRRICSTFRIGHRPIAERLGVTREFVRQAMEGVSKMRKPRFDRLVEVIMELVEEAYAQDRAAGDHKMRPLAEQWDRLYEATAAMLLRTLVTPPKCTTAQQRAGQAGTPKQTRANAAKAKRSPVKGAKRGKRKPKT